MNGRVKFFVALLVVVALVGWGIFQHRQDAETQQALKYGGTVDFREVALAFRGSDRIAEICVQEGDAVTKGQVLARLEQRELSYQLAKSKAELCAPEAGVIRTRILEPGAMASPAAPVCRLSLLDRKWVRIYVKETDLHRVQEGQQAEIFLDGRIGSPLIGQVGYISGAAEFTPKSVHTEDLRTSLVYEVRVDVQDAENLLRLGMPVTVKLKG